MKSFLWMLGFDAGGPLRGLLLAYVDPGAGSLLLQLLLGGVAGAAVLGKMYWKRLTGLFRRRSPGNEATSESPASERLKPE